MHEHDILDSCEIILTRIKTDVPKLAIMLGSGLGFLTDSLTKSVTISYQSLPGFPELTVKGHEGAIVSGLFNNVPILCLKGRMHAYETDDLTPLKTMIRTLKAAEIETLMTTSASGSLNPDMPAGSIMAIRDHINMMGINPLIGPNNDDIGPRFPSMHNAWDRDSFEIMKKSAEEAKIKLFEGVYVAFRGPCFETEAEVKMAKIIGGDAVGMSAVPECIIARHCGLKVTGCAVISNMAEGMNTETLSHEQTLAGVKLAEDNLKKLVEKFVPNFAQNTKKAA